ncbi:MAG: hypothetical protein Q8L86_13740 [Vicinamibacterales bacterium]|nr:hypothetical protein [Vicinamibacterales bacterium]
MMLSLAVVLGVVVAVCGRLLSRVEELGYLEWSGARAEAATEATLRYLGAPYEHARRTHTGAMTTREGDRLVDHGIVQERERRLSAMTRRAEVRLFRQVG